MDAFEQIVGMLLRCDGYWVHPSYKVKLKPAEKKSIGKPSCPRTELDIVAYSPARKEVLVVECKSLLDSPGVRYDGLSGANTKGARRYKLFTDKKLREVVLDSLKRQLCEEGRIPLDTGIKLCLAAGHIRKKDRADVEQHCRSNGWELLAEDWFRERFTKLGEADYENDIAIVAAKLARLAVQ